MSRIPVPIVVVQGAQFGSEAKGAIAAKLCIDRDIHYAVRTGAINAGHTVVYKGEKFAMQQLPTGWVNPKTQLVIGAGAYIHPDTLWREIDIVNRAMPEHDVRNRLIIDSRCGIHDEAAEGRSKETNRHHRIGATGKGCSEAIVAKIRDRNNGYELFFNTSQGHKFREHRMGNFADTVHILNRAYDDGGSILIEGTQGTLLDLHIGPYPFTTSRMTTAANWVAEAGLSPALSYEVVLVARTFPIRVAGNSGPMDNEIDWVDLAFTINERLVKSGREPLVGKWALTEFRNQLQSAANEAVRSERYQVPTVSPGIFNLNVGRWDAYTRSTFRVAASELHRDALTGLANDTVAELRKLFETTTVTKKLRRIAEISIPNLKFAIEVNRPKWIALTFLDYSVPELARVGPDQILDPANDISAALEHAADEVESLAHKLGVPIKMVSTGPAEEHCFSTEWLRERVSTR